VKKIMIIAVILLLNISLCLNVFGIKVEEKFDFESDNEGTTMLDTELYELFETSSLIGEIKVVSEANNQYLEYSGYSDSFLINPIVGPYTFSIDVKKTDLNENHAIFVRAVRPENLFYNGVFSGDSVVPFYESDWYSQNGGSGPSGLGASGIAVTLLPNVIRVITKIYTEEAMTITQKTTDIPFEFPASAFVNLKFVDDGESKVEIYANSTLIAKVEMSGTGIKYDTDTNDSDEYFKTVTVKDKDDNVLYTVENTRVSSNGSTIAIGNRETITQVDNIILEYEEPDPTPTPEATAAPEETATPKVNPTATKSGTNNTDKASVDPLIIVFAAVGAVSLGVIIFIIVRRTKEK
jgi:hypothetical protein